jgi:hypothetical protein
MDKVETQLRNVARNLAAALQSRFHQTAAEISELEGQLRQLKVQHAGEREAQVRLASYLPHVNPGAYGCPNCWLTEGKDIHLSLVIFHRTHEDILRCFSCGRDFGISVRT